MNKIIVSDASPLIALAKLDCLDLLFVSFSEIHVPQAVFEEATYERHRLDSQRIYYFVQDNESVIVHDNDSGDLYQKFRSILDEGESQALALASKLSCAILLDERLGRSVASKHQIPVVGVMGVLLKAKQQGKIPAIKPMIENLQAEDFRLSDRLIKLVLKKANES